MIWWVVYSLIKELNVKLILLRFNVAHIYVTASVKYHLLCYSGMRITIHFLKMTQKGWNIADLKTELYLYYILYLVYPYTILLLYCFSFLKRKSMLLIRNSSTTTASKNFSMREWKSQSIETKTTSIIILIFGTDNSSIITINAATIVTINIGQNWYT